MANAKLICIFFLVAISYVLSDRFVGGGSLRIGNMERKGLVKHKGTLKTIEGNDGDIIDCVDIYQQPAFDHPLLKNHTIQMEPGSIPNVTNRDFYDAEQSQILLEKEQCPEGTIPIRHEREDEYYAPRVLPPIIARQEKLNGRLGYSTIGHEYAQAQMTSAGGNYYGAHANINVWNPMTNAQEISIAQIWVISGPYERLNTAEAGWMVNSRGINKPKLFIYWTGDGYHKTGCYNLECPGFVQVNNKIALGSTLNRISSYMGSQYSVGITIYKSKGNWWLQVKDQVLGYWPSSIFKELAINASGIAWGGEIFDSRQQEHHTTTQMGSGHFPSDGYKKASYFRNLLYMDGKENYIDPNIGTSLPGGLLPYASNPKCYDIEIKPNQDGNYGTHFYFGGPGYSAICP